MEEAERTRQKELENEKLRRDLEEMKLAAAREHQARLEKDVNCHEVFSLLIFRH